jgi:hypothetical protein
MHVPAPSKNHVDPEIFNLFIEKQGFPMPRRYLYYRINKTDARINEHFILFVD